MPTSDRGNFKAARGFVLQPGRMNATDSTHGRFLCSSSVCRDAATGFTLLELLVVLVILGIVAGVVSLSVAPGEHRRMSHEVDRLAALFRLAHDETRVSGRPITWIADTDGYRFVVEDSVRGDEMPDDPLRPRAWPFPVQDVDAPVIVFGREPLLNPVKIRVAGSGRVLMLRLDEFGTLTEVR
jgi:general secretion pathway protein H